MSLAFPKKPGRRRVRDAVVLTALLGLLSGCNYSFTGGGLPQHIRRVYIEPFENNTPYPGLESILLRELQDRFPGSLGVRLASQSNADAVVRGKLNSAEEQTTNINPNTDASGRIGRLEAQVQVSFDAEIYDVQNDAVLWRGNGITSLGTFTPPGEDVEDGRRKALQQAVQRLIEGAQSQW
jgi:outer membrane lipopolysaccharide assembly protein LptE/RlpB